MTNRYPNLFLAGAPKCGTTSLFDWLSQHPDIFAPVKKEPILFRDGLSIEHAMSLDERLAIYRGWNDEAYGLEGSTHHFYSANAAEEIKAASPDARIIMALRNPASATYSMFHQMRYSGAEELEDFGAALAAEPERAANLHPLRRGIAESRLYSRVYAYRDNIERYLKVFGEERVHIVLLDDLKASPVESLKAIFDWLEIDPDRAAHIDIAKKNEAKSIRSRMLLDLAWNPPQPFGAIAHKVLPPVSRRRIGNWLTQLATKPGAKQPPMGEEMHDRLIKQHEGNIAWLEDLLARDLGHWRTYAPRPNEMASDQTASQPSPHKVAAG